MQHFIYIPGLGDRLGWLRRLQWHLMRSWRVYGARVELFPVRWSGEQLFAERLDELLARIDELAEEGRSVSLIGSSAGASAAINAFSRRPNAITSVVCICGALQNTKTLPESVQRLNPRFAESADLLPGSVTALGSDAKAHIRTYRPLIDSVVLPRNAMLPGARNRRVMTLGHLFTIGYCLNTKGYWIARFARHSASHSSRKG